MSLFLENAMLRAALTGVTPLDDTHDILCEDLSIEPQGDVVERNEYRGHFGAKRRATTNRRLQTTFLTRVAGSGTAGDPAQHSPLLRACGMEETVVAVTSVAYTPRSTGFESCTLEPTMDRHKHSSANNQGNLTLTLPSGDFPSYNFTFTGDYSSPADIGAPVVYSTPGNIEDSLIGNSTVVPTLEVTPVVDGTPGSAQAICVSEISIDLGQNVSRRQLYNCEKNEITGRAASITLTYDAELLATFDPFAIWEEDDQLELDVQHGTVAGNITTIAVPLFHVEGVTYGEADGVIQQTLTGALLPVSGDDEITITET